MSRIDAALDALRAFDALALRQTPLSRIDPRAKVVATAVFLIAVVSYDRYAIAALLPLAAFPIALATVGEVPARALARKLLVAAPFAVMVGLFNPWLDRAPIPVFGTIEVAGGWLSFASIVLRFALTVSAALILVACTGMHGLSLALRRLGLPQVFVTQLLFLHRYAFVLGGEAARMMTARDLRAPGAPAMALPVYGPLVGHLLLRAFERAHRLHLAMRARGFDGEVRSLQDLRWRWRDTVFVLGWCAFFALARGVDLSQWLGGLLYGVGA